MTIYQSLRPFLFLMLPICLNATVYLERPEDFQPKAEIVGCFLEYGDQILMLHRQEHCVQGNCWGVPGGKINKSETPLQAIIRETMEETGFDISKQRIIDLGKVYIQYPKYDEIYHMFKCRPVEHPGSVKISFDEHKGFTWVSPKDALKMNLMLEEDTCIKMVYPYQTSPILGDWSGILDIGMMKMTLVLHIQKNSDGGLSATVDTLEHKINGTPIDWIEFDEGTLKFEMKAAFAKFEGLLIENNSKISGQFVQAGQSFSLVFERGVKSVEPPNRPQEPKLPYPYTEEHISFENPEAGITLSGTLTLPASAIQSPVVLLIAGSGPLDRDEAALGHKPFLVLSDHLTREGIAVLRFDKRGCGKSTGNYNTATSQDFANDVLAGIEYLKSRKEVNANQIGLIGHSEGGIIAPMVAVKSKDVAFIVLLAGPGVTGEKLLYEQDGLIKQSMGETAETIKQNHEFQKQLFALLKNEPDLQIASAQFHEIATNHIATLQDNPGKVSVDLLEAMAHSVNTEWFRYFLLHDPAIALKQVQAPILALNGEYDLQVSPKQNLSAISKALQDSGNEDFTIVELPKLNHLFQSCDNGSVEEYAKIEETISPSVLDVISTWIMKRTIQKTDK